MDANNEITSDISTRSVTPHPAVQEIITLAMSSLTEALAVLKGMGENGLRLKLYGNNAPKKLPKQLNNYESAQASFLVPALGAIRDNGNLGDSECEEIGNSFGVSYFKIKEDFKNKYRTPESRLNQRPQYILQQQQQPMIQQPMIQEPMIQQPEAFHVIKDTTTVESLEDDYARRSKDEKNASNNDNDDASSSFASSSSSFASSSSTTTSSSKDTRDEVIAKLETQLAAMMLQRDIARNEANENSEGIRTAIESFSNTQYDLEKAEKALEEEETRSFKLQVELQEEKRLRESAEQRTTILEARLVAIKKLARIDATTD